MIVERPVQMTVTVVVRAHRHSIRHRDEVMASARCGIDTVMGTESGDPVTPDLLSAMKPRWF